MTSSSRLRAVVVGVGVAVLLATTTLTASTAHASVATDPLPSANVNGTVYATAQVGDRTIIGGDFTSVGAYDRQNVAAILPDGKVDPTWNPSANGIVRALAVSSDGSRVFLGGEFTTIGAVARARLAAVNTVDGATISQFRTRAANVVTSLALSGDRLYVGGAFGKIGGQAVPRLAALDATNGDVDTTFVPQPNRKVRAITVAPGGDRVYAVGAFTTVSNVARPGAVELTSGGALTDFAPTDGGVGIAAALAADGDLFFFSTTNNRTWAYDPDSSDSPLYRVRTGGDVQAIAVGAEEVYIGGHFEGLPEWHVSRPHIASFTIADGVPTEWYVDLNQFWGVWAFTVTPDYLAVGGAFTQVNGLPQRGFARFAGTP